VRKALKPEHRVLYMQATETSTGVRHDVEGIAKLLKEAGSELCWCGRDYRPRHHALRRGRLGDRRADWRLAEGGNDSAGPGLSERSEKAWAAMEGAKNPRFYFDLRKERKNAVKGESAYTPAVALIVGLGAALDYIAGQAGGAPGKRPHCADRQRAGECRGDAGGTGGAGFTLFAPRSGGGGYGRGMPEG